MKGMLLTAGLGTRLRPVTDQFAKPAVPFLGVPLLKYAVSLMKDAGVNEITFNTHYKPEQIEKIVSGLKDVTTHISHEPGEPLGSGGGIWKAKKFLSGDFLVGNGDEVILPHDPSILQRFIDEHRSHNALATILVMNHPLVGTQFGGVWCDQMKNVRGFGKDSSKFGSDIRGYHYIGLLLLNEKIFDYLPEGESNILYDALTAAIAKGETVRAVDSEFTWFETGNPKDFLHATGEALELFANGKSHAADELRKIVEKNGGEKLKLESPDGALVLRHESAKVSRDVGFKGFAVLSEDSFVENGAHVENSVLLPGALVESRKRHTGEIIL